MSYTSFWPLFHTHLPLLTSAIKVRQVPETRNAFILSGKISWDREQDWDASYNLLPSPGPWGLSHQVTWELPSPETAVSDSLQERGKVEVSLFWTMRKLIYKALLWTLSCKARTEELNRYLWGRCCSQDSWILAVLKRRALGFFAQTLCRSTYSKTNC